MNALVFFLLLKPGIVFLRPSVGSACVSPVQFDCVHVKRPYVERSRPHSRSLDLHLRKNKQVFKYFFYEVN